WSRDTRNASFPPTLLENTTRFSSSFSTVRYRVALIDVRCAILIGSEGAIERRRATTRRSSGSISIGSCSGEKKMVSTDRRTGNRHVSASTLIPIACPGKGATLIATTLPDGCGRTTEFVNGEGRQ